MLGNLVSFFLPSADFFSKSTSSKNSFKNTITLSNSLDPDQARHLVGPDLGPNYLQRLSADDAGRIIYRILIDWSIYPFVEEISLTDMM